MVSMLLTGEEGALYISRTEKRKPEHAVTNGEYALQITIGSNGLRE